MLVTEFAKRCKTSPHTVRYYVRLGLLRPIRGLENAYHHFTDDDVHRYQVIQLGQLLGLSLQEIGQLLDAVPRNGCCSHFRAVLEEKLATVQAQITDLQQRASLLQQTLTRWQEREHPYCRPTDASGETCPVIAAAEPRPRRLDL